MTLYGSLDYESQKIKKIVLSTTVAELYSFVKCFGSCQFLCGLWMDLSGEVANIHMRTDAKKLITAARTIHLPAQTETIHMISVLRKEASSRNTHDLAHIPTKNCFGRLQNPYGAQGLLANLVQNIFAQTREKEVFFLNIRKISLAQTSQERPFKVMFAVTQHTKEQKEFNTRERKGQDATKITAALAESCIQFPWSVMLNSMTALTWMERNIPNRNSIEDFTEEIDDGEFVRQYNFSHLLTRMLYLCVALMNLLLSVAPPSSSLVTMALSIPHCVVKSDSLSLDDDRLRETYYEALAFARHSINLELDEEIMKPEKANKSTRNSGIDPSTMNMKQRYQGQDRVSDQKALTGTERASYQVREPIEDDEERRAMRQGHLPSPVPERVANPRIREDRAVQDFPCNSEKMHRATYEDAYTTKAWFDYCRSVFPQTVSKAGPNVDLYNVSTYQCIIIFNNMGSFNRKSEFRKAENMYIHQMKSSTPPTTLSCHFSESSGETTTRM